ncbi:glycosyltransferase family 2 protein [Winogradskyella sp.]|nr:glycosyltransferase family 2 protein [Winogradskyella sp.]
MPSNRDFAVSVITPVYNAEIYLRKAVESAVYLDEVGEIILVEDHSPDNALVLCQILEQEYPKVKLYQHSDKGNHGAGASRNLGIQKASCNYIAFLDADDYYLPNRFTKDKVVFKTHADCDGVYSATGTHFYTAQAKKQFFDKGFGYQEVLTLTKAVTPEDLFSALFNKHTVTGEFHTNGITLKKNVFTTVGNFNTQLKLRQDIHLWKRLAAFCTLYAGEIAEPVSMRGIHADNRMTRIADHQQYLNIWWKSLKHEFKSKHLETSKYNIFEQAYFNYVTAQPNKLKALLAFIENVVKQPKIIKEAYGDFDFNFWKVFGRNKLTVSAISFKNKLFNSNH